MKLSIRNALLVATVSVALCIPAFANEVNLVVTKKADIRGAQTEKLRGNTPQFETISVKLNGRSQDEILKEMLKSGTYSSVELDVEISHPTPRPKFYPERLTATEQSTTYEPNDTDFHYQRELFAENNGENAGADILNAWELLGNDIENSINVVVLDSGFVAYDDVTYETGRDFIGDREDPKDFWADGEGCSKHGSGVASVIAATIDNNLRIAGIAPNVKLHAGRVMNCGSGRLSRVAIALDAFSDNNVPGFDGVPGVFNLSLGGVTGICPQFIQEAIDRAVNKGWKIVVAAGNDGIEVSRFTPANCQNVVTVGATDNAANQTSFSNYGEGVDISAQGEDVTGLCRQDGRVCWWSGTSFASPIVAGVVALTEKVGGLETPFLKRVMKSSSFSLAADCPNGECNAGLINAKAAVEASIKSAKGQLNTIEHLLNDKQECKRQWLVDHFGQETPICSMYQLTFMGGYSAESESYRLARLPKVDSSIESLEIIGEFEQTSLKLRDIDAANFDYKFQICNEGVCEETWHKMNTENAMKPAGCME